jgi:hypothetical protein
MSDNNNATGAQPERWASVPGHPDYEASDRGWVRNAHTGTVLKARFRRGYANVTLSMRSGHRRHFVHTLVLSAFVGPRPKGCETRHLNGNRGDNRLSNLAWGTPAENSKDRVRHGTTNRGERSPQAKLTEQQVREIRRFPAGVHNKEIAARYGVTYVAVHLIRTGQRWGWLGEAS